MCGREFTVDAFCNANGSNSLCKRFFSQKKSFLKANLVGDECYWINSPFSSEENMLRHYVECKLRNPSISACILVPKWMNCSWRKYLTGMELLVEYEPGSILFTQPLPTGERQVMPGIPWGIKFVMIHPTQNPKSITSKLKSPRAMVSR